MSFIPKPQEIYKHFKGNLYQVTAVAEHTETGQQLVVYQALYGDFKTYARPLEMFTSRVDWEKYPDADQEFRFELQGPEADRQRAESTEGSAAFSVQPAIPEQSAASMQPETQARWAGDTEAAVQSRTADAYVSRWQDTDTRLTVRFEAEQAEYEELEEPKMQSKTEELTEGELALDPLVLEFLDADGYEQRLNILAGLHHRITNDMITTMAIACDVEINDGDVEERYEALKTCLVTLQRYECSRVRYN